MSMINAPGRVSFVGIGPGDIGLLTVRAVDRLAHADVVVVEQLSTRDHLLAMHCPATAIAIDVADLNDDPDSATSRHALSSLQTCAQRARRLAALAQPGVQVVRLLDGDPSASSGLAEEIRACRAAGASVEIVPGVAAATAVPAYAGVILGTSEAATVHAVNLSVSPEGNWSWYVDDSITVVLMGTEEQVCDAVHSLIEAGRRPDTPAVLVADGASPRQRSVTSPAGHLVERARGIAPGRQVVAVIGAAASAASTNAWFESRPLFGWRVLVPRTKEQAAAVVSALEGHGALTEVVPTIAVEPPRTSGPIDKAIVGLVTGRYAWVGFTSVNAVRAVREKFHALGLDLRSLAGVNIAAVGGVTADALREWGIEPDLMPTGDVEQSSVGLLEVWPDYEAGDDPMDRVFLPRADIATETLVAGLAELGWQVDDVTAYRTVRAAPPPAQTREAIKTGQFDAVLFTSSSTVRNLIGIAGKPHARTVVACIGPATAKTAQEHGLRVDVVAPEPRMSSLVQALAEFGERWRMEALASGETVLRPSQRRTVARRRAR